MLKIFISIFFLFVLFTSKAQEIVNNNEKVRIFSSDTSLIFSINNRKYFLEPTALFPIGDEKGNIDSVRLLNFIVHNKKYQVIVFAIDDSILGNRSNIISYKITEKGLVPLEFQINDTESYNALISFNYINLVDSKGNIFMCSGNSLSKNGEQTFVDIDKYIFDSEKGYFKFSKRKRFVELPKDRIKIFF